MKISSILSFFGSAMPYIFPKHEFSPRNAIGAVLMIVAVSLSVKLLGVDGAESVAKIVADIVSSID